MPFQTRFNFARLWRGCLDRKILANWFFMKAAKGSCTPLESTFMQNFCTHAHLQFYWVQSLLLGIYSCLRTGGTWVRSFGNDVIKLIKPFKVDTLSNLVNLSDTNQLEKESFAISNGLLS